MYSQEELNISNKSYINKDFPTLYNELLDIAQKISYKYDPTTSNESDPMIVLLKLIALAGDKLNYNVDKNILERFLTSITQWNCMQERTSSLGYNMHYYKSAIGYINFKYTKNITNDDVVGMIGQESLIRFPAFKTKVSNSQNNVNYILTKDIEFTKDDLLKHTPKEGTMIQGDLKLFTTLNGDESLVSLNDLDNLNRLYFPEAMVAQNGVFIEQSSIKDEWEQVDNLNIQLPLTRCFVFRYDSSRKLPYIQFPDDISSLINDGLTIRYVITNGENGNVSANNVDTLLVNGEAIEFGVEPEDDTLTTLENYSITNPSALTNGTDIENIDEAYNNFYKTVGTFDTLVACRDYANFIYNLSDEDFNSLVSNVQVCDRRDDYNYSTKIVTYNDFGQTTVTDVEDGVDAFDLMLYPLQPMPGTNTSAYKTSFKPLTNTAFIIRGLEDSKCLSHNYKDLVGSDIYAIKNYYQLKAKITTTYKVNSLEQLSIKENIILALINNFNARKVDYGTEIPYDSILKVIENADARIKFVSLDEPSLTTKLLLQNGSEVDWEDTTDYHNKINYIAKNVLAGKTPLYNYDETFNYNYGQSDTHYYEDIQKVNTTADITPTLVNSNYEYTLQPNEVVQIFTPSFINGREWSYGWFYKFSDNGWDDYNNTDTTIALGGGRVIYIYDSKDATEPTETLNTGYVKLKGIPKKTTITQINSGASITEQSPNKVTLTSTCNLYWITNNVEFKEDDEGNKIKQSRIKWDNEGKYVLLDNEFLYMTDSRYSYLTAFGPGTELVKTGTIFALDVALDVIDLDELESKGLIYLKDKFQEVEFNANDGVNAKQLTLVEQQILTLTEGDFYSINTNITYTVDESGILYNVISPLDTSVVCNYTLTDETTGKILAENGGYIRARLDLNCSSKKSQYLYTHQYVTLYDNETIPNTTTLNPNTYISSQYEINVLGGRDRTVQVFSYDNKTYLDNSFYSYQLATADNSILNIATTFGNYYRLSIVSGKCSGQTSVTIPVPTRSHTVEEGGQTTTVYHDTLLLVYVSPGDDNQVSGGVVTTLVVSNGGNSLTTGTTTGTQLLPGLNVLRFRNTSSDSPFTITFNYSGNNFTGNIIVSKPRLLVDEYDSFNSMNTLLGINNTQLTSLLDIIDSHKANFYYSLYVDNSSYIDENLMDPYTLFDTNNIVNKIVIPEIDMDFAISNISVAKSSQI